MGDNTSFTTTLTVTPQITSVQSLPNVTHQLPVKLNSTNYLLWRAQLLPLLRSYDLASHIDGSTEPPSLTIDNEQANPAYLNWHCQDQLVLSWIVGSIFEVFIPQVVGAATAHAA